MDGLPRFLVLRHLHVILGIKSDLDWDLGDLKIFLILVLAVDWLEVLVCVSLVDALADVSGCQSHLSLRVLST